MMKGRFKKTLWIIVFMLTLIVPATALAELEAYLVKDGSTVYSYPSKELDRSFLNDGDGLEDTYMYQDFKEKFLANGFYSFKDSANGYLEYAALDKAFLDAESGAFNLNEYLSDSGSTKVTDLPSTIKEAYVEDKTVKYRDVNTGSDGGSGGDGDDDDDLDVKTVYSMDNTHIRVEFNTRPSDSDIDKSNFTFVPSLEVKQVDRDSQNTKVIILTTAEHTPGARYQLQFKGKNAGTPTDGLAAGVIRPDPPTGVTVNPDTGAISGITEAGYEYSTDGGESWQDYDPNNPPTGLTGEVWIRKKADGNTPAGIPLIVQITGGGGRELVGKVDFLKETTAAGTLKYIFVERTVDQVFSAEANGKPLFFKNDDRDKYPNAYFFSNDPELSLDEGDVVTIRVFNSQKQLMGSFTVKVDF
jgi:hypothetical protein